MPWHNITILVSICVLTNQSSEQPWCILYGQPFEHLQLPALLSVCQTSLCSSVGNMTCLTSLAVYVLQTTHAMMNIRSWCVGKHNTMGAQNVTVRRHNVTSSLPYKRIESVKCISSWNFGMLHAPCLPLGPFLSGKTVVIKRNNSMIALSNSSTSWNVIFGLRSDIHTHTNLSSTLMNLGMGSSTTFLWDLLLLISASSSSTSPRRILGKTCTWSWNDIPISVTET